MRRPADRLLRQPYPQPLPGLRYHRPEQANCFALKDVMLRGGCRQLRPHGIDRVYVRSVTRLPRPVPACAHAATAWFLRRANLSIWARQSASSAAQSIPAGSPAPRLTMRTFPHRRRRGRRYHAGPSRVEELFEARKPKKMAQISEIDGVVDVDDSHRARRATSPLPPTTVRSKQYQVRIPHVGLKVEDTASASARANPSPTVR